MSLEYGGSAVYVYHESRKEIAFAVYESVCVIVWTQQPESLTQTECGFQS